MSKEPFIKMCFNGDRFTLETNGTDEDLCNLIMNSLMAEPKLFGLISTACLRYVINRTSDEDKANLN